MAKQLKCMHCRELFELEKLRPSGYCSPCLKEVRRMYNITEPKKKDKKWNGKEKNAY